MSEKGYQGRFGRDKDWRETAGRERMQSMQGENIGTGGMPKMMLSAYSPLMGEDITRLLREPRG